MDKAPIAVIGTGQMGPGIGVTVALVGHPVTLYGRTEASVARGLTAVDAVLELLTREEIISPEAAAAAGDHISGTTDLAQAVRDAAFVFESIEENLTVKQRMFEQLEAFVAPDTILASNTSGLRISDIAANLQHPERAVTTHFWNPPHLIPLVDIVKGERTSDATIEQTRALLLDAGKRPVVVLKDTAGQLGIRLLHAVKREAFSIIEQGLASPEDVDIAIRYGPGMRFGGFGPIEHTDTVGLDMVLAVQESVVPGLCHATEPSRLLREKVARGELGVKTGKGFFDWSQRDPREVTRRRDQWLIRQLKAMAKEQQPAPAAADATP
jgi:3-hydroxybutyryl-CoA dehydrogenase